MSKLDEVIRHTLKAAQEESRAGELAVLGQRLRDTLNDRLGGVDIFGTVEDQSGGLLRVVADKSGIAVAFHMGGTLHHRGFEGDRVCYEIIGGEGRSFKFMPHSEYEPVEKEEFYGAGFPYSAGLLCLSKVTGGTVARVKTGVQHVFCTDVLSRVTAYSIEDVRLYQCGGALCDAVQTVFEEAISDVGGEWERIFRLLNS